MTPQPAELNGICCMSKQLDFSIVWKPQMNFFKFTLRANMVAGCEEECDNFKVVCNNEPSDTYATYRSTIQTPCLMCDINCASDHLVASESRTKKSTGGMPSEFQALRDLMNQTCNDFGDLRIPESVRSKLGPDTISGQDLHDAILAELNTLFPDLGDAINTTCSDVTQSGVCQCGSKPGPQYDGISPSQKV